MSLKGLKYHQEAMERYGRVKENDTRRKEEAIAELKALFEDEEEARGFYIQG